MKKQNVIIVGGGTAGWMCAAALSKLIGNRLNITLVESEQIGTIGVGEATVPTFLTLHRLLKIDEADFLSKVQGTIKLGISFENWRKIGHQYIHSFGFTGQGCWAAGFQHFWLKGKQLGVSEDYGDYTPELKAAKENKFGFLKEAPLHYAYHIDAGRYATFLRHLAEREGVTRIEGIVQEVGQREDGAIKDIVLESGQVIEGDFFVDCTGFAGLLIEKTLKTEFETWQHWLPCDRAIAVQTAATETPIPYTRSIAHGFGWQWRIPLQERVGNGLVFSSEHVSDDEAQATLMSNLSGETLIEPRLIRFKTGQRCQHWRKNCVAIGLSAGFLEPLESTSIHLIQRAIIRLMQLFPHDGNQESERDEFNRQMREEFELVRDFIILHYHATERDDSRFWQHVSSMAIPETLKQKINLFRQTGNIFQNVADVFGENSWSQVMLGQGIMPAAYHPIVDMMDDTELANFLRHHQQRVDQIVSSLPAHETFLRQYCSSR
ncbi:tryptophan 7-halogenase [Pseudomonadales bacterium]|jgi:tryptophan halogenase|nr:tryptophan 7-halogenase [Gammaproteobacteria bacterium]MDA8627769.1 tryptophan 7-halogenase [Pseudomonadales bacterium]MDB2707163.1 tryptophan 7-halogenase [Pseudomonadales bacterium]MDC1299311.1 tryptophan 7-halogenase [Pseudomonadales bacterium]